MAAILPQAEAKLNGWPSIGNGFPIAPFQFALKQKPATVAGSARESALRPGAESAKTFIYPRFLVEFSLYASL
jgi:hypothetical protein